MSWPLLKTKLEIPIVQSKLISRPHLLERLNGCLAHKLTLVCAPAGYGKTTCLSQWAKVSKLPIAWVSIDLSDNDPAHFWTYIVTALKTLDNTIGKVTLDMLRSYSQPLIMETAITVLFNELSSWGKQCVLVLDDYHLITDETILNAVAYSLEHLPKQVHLIISSRSTPHLPLSRLRVQHQLSELNILDLRFSHAEAATFLNELMGLDLSASHVAKLGDRTEGWIAGLQLAALSLQGRKDIADFIDSFTGSHHYIADYLVEEIFNQQQETVKSFLLQTSILERMNGPLCEYITGMNESATILEWLEDANLFVVPLDDERQWYRYHVLFQEILLDRLQKIHPERIPELQRRASIWYEKNGYPNDAIHYALMEGDYNRAANLIENRVIDTFNRGEMQTIISWLNALPEDLIRSRPGICVAHAYAVFMSPSAGSYQIVEQRLHDAEEAIHSTTFNNSERPYKDVITGYIAGIRAYLARDRGDSPQSIIDFSKKALKNIRKDNLIPRSAITLNLAIAYRTIGDASAASSALEEVIHMGQYSNLLLTPVYSTYLLAQVTFIQGHLKAAVEICQNALKLYDENQKDTGQLPVVGALHACLGDILLEENYLADAEKHLTKGLEFLKIFRDMDALIACYTALVRLKIAQHAGFSEVMSLIDEMEQVGLEAIQYGVALRIRLLLSQAEQTPDSLSAAALLAQRSGLDLQDHEPPPGIDHAGQRRCELQQAFVRLLISQRRIFPNAQGQPELENVLEFLDRRLYLAKKRGLTTGMIRVLILKALTHQARGEMEIAVTELQQALTLAKPEGFIRIFVDEGESMGKLLRKAISRGICHDYTTQILQILCENIGESGRKIFLESSSALIEPISKRELQILRLVAAGLSNREIAEELFLAIGTIKKHINNIYGKLNVNKRTQAVARAQELSLLRGNNYSR